MKLQLTTALVAMVLSAGAASANVVSVNSEIGPVMAASDNGLTLYTFRKDSANTSNCYDSCADAWPPFMAKAGDTPAKGLGIIERRDGTKQYAINGKPLYFWAGDAAKGDVTGDGVGGVWDAVRR